MFDVLVSQELTVETLFYQSVIIFCVLDQALAKLKYISPHPPLLVVGQKKWGLRALAIL